MLITISAQTGVIQQIDISKYLSKEDKIDDD